MKEIVQSQTSVASFHDIEVSKERSFGYEINVKKAKKKLLKGAERAENLTVEVKSGCVNLKFCDGAFHEIVLPLLREWSSKVNETLRVSDTDITILEVTKGSEKSNKHVDTLLWVMQEWNSQKLIFKYIID